MKPPPPLERHLLQQVTQYLKILQASDPTLQFRKRHGSPFTTAGDPDLYLLWHSTHAEIELKPPGKTLTPLQTARLSQWQAAGALTFIVHSIPELQTALQTIRQSPKIAERKANHETREISEKNETALQDT